MGWGSNAEFGARGFGAVFGGGGSAPDTTPPSVPANLTAAAQSDTEILVSWDASTGDVAGYEYRVDGGSPVDVGNTLSDAVTGLTAETEYDFEVRSYDDEASPNYSAWSSVVSETTEAAAAWTPASLTQAIHWYRAKSIDDGVDGSPYTAWEDLIGANNTSSTDHPVYRAGAGNPYLEFNGTSDRMNTGITNAFTDFAWMVVMRNRGGSNYARYIDKTYTEAVIMRDGSAADSLSGGIKQGGGEPYGDAIELTENVLYAVVMQRNGTAKHLVAGSNVVPSVVAADALDASEISFGSATGGNAPYSPLDLFEVVICDDALSNGDLANFSAYVLAEYGLTLASSF